MKRREAVEMLRASGWHLLRQGGEHEMWAKGEYRFALPRHRELSPGVERSLRREIERAS